jgi:hypothetical protein
MSESSDDQSPAADSASDDEPVKDASGATEDEADDLAQLREQVEQKYDFENFGPAEMAEMSAREWEAAFDPDTWITGAQLLDRVEADLKNRVASRDVFARIERQSDRILAYSDTGYAVVYDDGSVEGEGTVLRDVKPTVALCSLEEYDVPEQPEGELLPEPTEVPEGTGELGNHMLQAVAAIQVLAGLALLGVGVLFGLGVVAPNSGVRVVNLFVIFAAGGLFVLVGVFLFSVVANARLSDKFRAEEYRNRLRAVDLEPGERPDFLPDEGDEKRLTASDDGASEPTDG